MSTRRSLLRRARQRRAARRRGAARRVHPLYVSAGLAWEPAERAIVGAAARARRRSAGACGRSSPLEFDMRDVYPPTHWAIRGEPPAYDTPDEDVYLRAATSCCSRRPAIYCAQRRHRPHRARPAGRQSVSRCDAGVLRGDGAARCRWGSRTDRDRDAVTRDCTRRSHRRGAALGVPFELTLSCMNPSRAGRHCGACSKCRERQDAFMAAGVEDRTRTPRNETMTIAD